MEPCMPTKKPLTEEDIKWCHEALEKAEPYTEEEDSSLLLDDRLFCAKTDIERAREKATRAKRMLERGWKY